MDLEKFFRDLATFMSNSAENSGAITKTAGVADAIKKLFRSKGPDKKEDSSQEKPSTSAVQEEETPAVAVPEGWVFVPSKSTGIGSTSGWAALPGFKIPEIEGFGSPGFDYSKYVVLLYDKKNSKFVLAVKESDNVVQVPVIDEEKPLIWSSTPEEALSNFFSSIRFHASTEPEALAEEKESKPEEKAELPEWGKAAPSVEVKAQPPDQKSEAPKATTSVEEKKVQEVKDQKIEEKQRSEVPKAAPVWDESESWSESFKSLVESGDILEPPKEEEKEEKPVATKSVKQEDRQVKVRPPRNLLEAIVQNPDKAISEVSYYISKLIDSGKSPQSPEVVSAKKVLTKMQSNFTAFGKPVKNVSLHSLGLSKADNPVRAFLEERLLGKPSTGVPSTPSEGLFKAVGGPGKIESLSDINVDWIKTRLAYHISALDENPLGYVAFLKYEGGIDGMEKAKAPSLKRNSDMQDGFQFIQSWVDQFLGEYRKAIESSKGKRDAEQNIENVAKSLSRQFYDKILDSGAVRLLLSSIKAPFRDALGEIAEKHVDSILKSKSFGVEEKPKPEPEQAQPKPEPQKAQPKPEPGQAQPKPEPQKAQPKPEPEQAQPKPESQKAQPKPESQKAQPKPEPQQAQPKPESQKAQPKPEPQKAQPKPEPQQAQPKPEPEQAQPKPEPQQAQPKPEPQQARPKPEQEQDQKDKGNKLVNSLVKNYIEDDGVFYDTLERLIDFVPPSIYSETNMDALNTLLESIRERIDEFVYDMEEQNKEVDPDDLPVRSNSYKKLVKEITSLIDKALSGPNDLVKFYLENFDYLVKWK